MARSSVRDYDRNVFINCPFDPEYLPLFRAMLFTILDCGYLVRSALEVEDSGEVRVQKIINLIKSCKFGIHDISRTESNSEGLPRFNMPFELGLFIGCAVFGTKNCKDKRALILDRERYRYARYISDIAGQDIQDHGNDQGIIIKKVRNWLANHTQGQRIPGGDMIVQQFNQFGADLPAISAELRLGEADLANYRDFHHCVSQWLVVHEMSRTHTEQKLKEDS